MTIAARHHAEAVIFDFVQPAWSEGRVSGSGGEAGLDEVRTVRTQTKQRHGPINIRPKAMSLLRGSRERAHALAERAGGQGLQAPGQAAMPEILQIVRTEAS